VSCYDRNDRTSYTYTRSQGIDPLFLRSITDQYGTIDKEKAKAAGYAVEPGDAWIAQDVDVLIPAAIEGQITGQTAGQISPRVKLVAEGANGPTTPEADEVLKQRSIFDIPDFLCNAGGVTTSYFESVQNDYNYYWEKDLVLSRLDQKMTAAFHGVLDVALVRDMYLRDAAYMVAIDRVVRAIDLRGWI